MELKDMILSTLEEIEEELPPVDMKQEENAHKTFEPVETSTKESNETPTLTKSSVDNELFFLKSIRERLLVLFEGFQAPNNNNIEAKVDMTLNFLEYVLVTIDSRVEELEKGRK